MVSDGNVFVVREQGLVWSEQLPDASSVVDRRVKVRVVRDKDGFGEDRAGDRVESGLGCLATRWFFVRVKKSRENFAEHGPGAVAEGHQGVERWGLTCFDEGTGEQA
jgi:hypothetical protein